MDPIVVVGAKEEYREVPDVVLEGLYVERNRPRTANLCWPPPVIPKLDPNDLLVSQLLAGFAVVAVPGAVGHLYVETLRVEGRRARFAAQELPTFLTFLFGS